MNYKNVVYSYILFFFNGALLANNTLQCIKIDLKPANNNSKPITSGLQLAMSSSRVIHSASNLVNNKLKSGTKELKPANNKPKPKPNNNNKPKPTLGEPQITLVDAQPLPQQRPFIDEFSENVNLFLTKYQRPFTVLCVGKKANLVGLKIAQNFKNSTFVLMNGGPEILKACYAQDLNNVVCIAGKAVHGQLIRMSECEHYDVTITCNIDEETKEFKQAQDALFRMGDYVIVAERGKPTKISNDSAQAQEKELTKSANIHAALYSTDNHYLLRKNFSREYLAMKQKYFVESAFDKKILYKRRDGEVLTSKWISGINLDTFACLGGGYPNKATVTENVMKCKQFPHQDYSVHNMVIQGKQVILIDFAPVSTVKPRTIESKFRIICKYLSKKLKV